MSNKCLRSKYISIALVVILAILTVAGFIADLSGYSNKKINQIIERKNFTKKTGQRYLLNLYLISIVQIHGEISSGDALRMEYGGEWSAKILLIAGMPVLLYDDHAREWE